MLVLRAATALVVGALLLKGLVAVAPSAAAAPGAVLSATTTDCVRVDIYTGRCLITASSPGTRSAGGSTGLTSSGSSSTGASCYSDWSSKVVPCSSALGSWSNSRDCYVQPSAENPVSGSLLFEGHTDGAVYTCTPDIGDQFQTAYSFWSATPPTGPDPAQLAQQAISAMGLTAITIGVVPEPDAASLGLVGLPVWMWVADPTPTSWGPETSSASAGGITVTATAHVERVVWDLGDGSSVTCGAGTAYTDAAGASPSPDCGHVYTRTSVGEAGDAYTITATSHWVIDWAGGGATGQVQMDLTSDAQLRIGETQAILTS